MAMAVRMVPASPKKHVAAPPVSAMREAAERLDVRCACASSGLRSRMEIRGDRKLDVSAVLGVRGAGGMRLMPFGSQADSPSKLQYGSRFCTRFDKFSPDTGSRLGSGRRAKGSWVLDIRCMGKSKTGGQPRGPLWRTRAVVSKETIQAVQDLRRNKDSPEDLAKSLRTRIPRLLKMDLLGTLAELQRLGEVSLALQIFEVVRNEIWYKPDVYLYRSMIDLLGKNRMIAEVEKKFQELQEDEIVPDLVIYRELVGAYAWADMIPEALDILAKMEEIGCGDDQLSLQFIETAKSKAEKRATSV